MSVRLVLTDRCSSTDSSSLHLKTEVGPGLGLESELMIQTREDPGFTGLDTTFVYKVVDGPCERDHYGD
jgi:hypothetical protein